MPPWRSFEIQVAGRMDYYSDFKFTFNPKASVRWQPSSKFLVRGTIGNSFLAPSMHALYGTVTEGYPFIVDTVSCFQEMQATNDFQKLIGDLGQSEELAKDFFD